MNNNEIVQKLWKLCDVLRDDGITYTDYVTELVLLLFIKMETEQAEAGITQHVLPEGCRWSDIATQTGIKQYDHYRQMLLDLGKHHDPLLAAIYAGAQTSLKEPKHLSQLVKRIDELDWFSAREDGLGDLYEGLLEKNANETKSGAGQYFTPRPLIDTIVKLMNPKAGEMIQDPAAGTAGFLIAAHEFIKDETDDLYDLGEKEQDFQKRKAYNGMELVPSTRRLALMNCLLHGIEGEGEGAIHQGNTLSGEGAQLPKVDLILSNPPFGTSKGGGGPTRDDLTYETSNKQLAFLQHIYRHLKPGGRAAVVLPDNVLFEGGVGQKVRADLMNKCNLHTILRLPTGIFYAQGVKTNVLFFQKGTPENEDQEENCTTNTWVYDMRTNMNTFGKRRPLTERHFAPFIEAYGSDANGQSPRIEGVWQQLGEVESDAENTSENARWKKFKREYIREQKGDSLDISWLKDLEATSAENLPEPEVLAGEAMAELTEAMSEIYQLMQSLGATDEAEQQKQLLEQAFVLEEKPEVE
ncbi:N-6 DNA methylase [Vibrio sp. 10N.286.46.E10]|uniref:class I SAM-dependent DNA methyltransferase n=1 Tax=Vibrio sp. 10N.286.46.E10 TaxID=1884477 RepID=UPI000C81DB6D|nr:N-6 DNA methylase [Vibrio sp. 10N.286.46.E10]PMI23890.1 SAM-dependent methyltransferase [Vibrio sp. 10N.286.46.E10]